VVDSIAWTAPQPEVAELAQAYGVATEYWDQTGNHKVISAHTLEKVLAALNVDVTTTQGRLKAWDRLHLGPWRLMVPSVTVARQGHQREVYIHVPDGQPVIAWIDLEAGGRVPMTQVDRYVSPRMVDGVLTGEATFAIPTDLPLGWHSIQATSDNEANKPLTGTGVLVVTPNYLELPKAMRDRRTWGLMAQLYATRSQSSWGLGDLHDLGQLAAWGGKQGAGFVLVNPMHAAEVAPPMAPSPYLPATRRYFNPIFLHIEDVPEFAKLGGSDRRKVQGWAAELHKLNTTADLLDRDRVWEGQEGRPRIDPRQQVVTQPSAGIR